MLGQEKEGCTPRRLLKKALLLLPASTPIATGTAQIQLSRSSITLPSPSDHGGTTRRENPTRTICDGDQARSTQGSDVPPHVHLCRPSTGVLSFLPCCSSIHQVFSSHQRPCELHDDGVLAISRAHPRALTPSCHLGGAVFTYSDNRWNAGARQALCDVESSASRASSCFSTARRRHRDCILIAAALLHTIIHSHSVSIFFLLHLPVQVSRLRRARDLRDERNRRDSLERRTDSV